MRINSISYANFKSGKVNINIPESAGMSDEYKLYLSKVAEAGDADIEIKPHRLRGFYTNRTKYYKINVSRMYNNNLFYMDNFIEVLKTAKISEIETKIAQGILSSLSLLTNKIAHSETDKIIKK